MSSSSRYLVCLGVEPAGVRSSPESANACAERTYAEPSSAGPGGRIPSFFMRL